MAGYKGAGDWNDDVTGKPAQGGGAYLDPSKDNRWSVGFDEWERQGGQTAFDRDVARSRARGAQGQDAVRLDQGQADESRAMQMGSLGMLEGAARGNAPSRAAAVGQMQTEASIRSGMAGMAGARGAGASIAAMRGAGAGMGQQMAQQNQQVMDQRAQEMARAQQGYASATQGARGQDIQAATVNAQLEAQQRAINEQRQQANERIGWDTRNSQMQGSNSFQDQQTADDLARRRLAAAQSAEDDANTKENVNIGLGIGTGGLGAL